MVSYKKLGLVNTKKMFAKAVKGVATSATNLMGLEMSGCTSVAPCESVTWGIVLERSVPSGSVTVMVSRSALSLPKTPCLPSIVNVVMAASVENVREKLY